jgi:hypothetical protein
MRLGCVVTVHVDREAGAPFYTFNLEGFGENRLKDNICSLFLLTLKRSLH